ncbi:NADP-dependent isocitrate dehydrogenase [Peptoniphilus sp. AGMB00490]|uniref:Isocitrate dehydrogenase [NADP] n=1 Tax=Peptoniphilus faecalis TaxID=2731255 RepID=A0A848R7M8_9FIRM|nr:NADP-dependent isocitrate dehydrogenase [Peptoniphilus faecalis]NMW85297.1 NADP-dependent isocitrate dehydrogenase [Peptoniphilus faecalis]
MAKIKMKNPIVEMDGDEMTRVIWKDIKKELLEPYIDLNLDYYDLSIENRNNTYDEVTIDSAKAVARHHIGVKCATITANEDRVKEFNLNKIYPSPNATIRAYLDGVMFREPIIFDCLNILIPTWKEPIAIARHSFGDIYVSKALNVKKGDELTVSINGEDKYSYKPDYDAIFLTQYNKVKSIEDFAHVSFKYAISKNMNLIFSTKDTVVLGYDSVFKEIFNETYKEYKDEFEKRGLNYHYYLIDNAIAQIMKSKGNILWALKNYDGDVMSDMISAVYGSLSLMESSIIGNGTYLYEAAHGTVTDHYRRYQKGEIPSTNSVALIFTWASGIEKRGQLDGNKELEDFGVKLKKSVRDTIESGFITGDLISSYNKSEYVKVNYLEFIEKVKEFLDKLI